MSRTRKNRADSAVTSCRMTLIRPRLALHLSLFGLAFGACGSRPGAGPSAASFAAACLYPSDGLAELDRDGDGALTLDDVDAGQSAMRIAWRDQAGEVWTGLYVSDGTKVVHGDYYGDQGRWGIWFKTECDPESAAFVWFNGPESEVLEDGSWGVYTLSWDVPEIERGGNDTQATGEVVLTVDGDTATGNLAGSTGVVPITDYLVSELTGETVQILDLVFRSIPAEID